jgi:tetratricopeptide (TPR) repeat protein
MAGINWIHLSDWHQNKVSLDSEIVNESQKDKFLKDNFDRYLIKDKLLEDIQQRAEIDSSLENIDFVIFSGDLTYNGRKDEFEEIKKELFDPLLKACGDLDPSRLFIVPGNHDLNRADFELLPPTLSNYLTEENASSWLSHNRRRAEVLKPFYEFGNFIDSYTKQEDALFGSSCELNFGEDRISLIGLNSALMCGRKDEQGNVDDEKKIIVGEPQIQEVLKKVSDSNIKIAVLHHPLEWLAGFDCRYIEERLSEVCNFILNGHVHYPRVKVINKKNPDEGNYVCISTGAAYGSRMPQDPIFINAYNFVHLDLVTKNGIIFPRHWNNKHSRWTEDLDSFLTSSIPFSLINPDEKKNSDQSLPHPGPIPEKRSYMDSLTFVRDLDNQSLSEFRNQLREEKRKRYPNNLSNAEFLRKSNLMVDGYLTRSGALLFGKNPQEVCRSAITQCTIYYGKDKGAKFKKRQFDSTIPNQIIGCHNYIASQVGKSEDSVAGWAQLETRYEYPMKCVREIIANALAHRNYEDHHRLAHIYLFSDRMEILSPGNWYVKPLIEGKQYPISDLISPSIKRNYELSQKLSWIELMEVDGRGIPKVIQDCKENNAPMPVVIQKDGFVTVTIWPSRDIKKMIAYIIPHQIPSPPADFAGREYEISHILSIFENGATISGLRGMGGVGKTALALVLAERLKDRFSDGQIFLNMQGNCENPLKTEEAMAHVIRTYLGVDAWLPEDLNSLSGLYHSVLFDKRILILLDNAASCKQVEPLLPPSGSALLITSRNKFAVPGLDGVDLDILPLEDAKKLLLGIAERIGDHAEELAKLCGCLPLALRNAAFVLREQPNLALTNYIKILGDATRRLDLVEASFSLSYDLLSHEQQRLWSLLSVFPADFDVAGAAAIWEMEHVSAENALGELVRLSLVDFLPSAKGDTCRYRLHDLARVFSRHRLDPRVLNQAQLRHATHYSYVLSLADQRFTRGKDDLLSGLSLFDQERINILEGQSWAEKNLETNPSAISLCKTFPAVGAYVLDLRLNFKEKMLWLKAALHASRQSMDSLMEGIHLGNLGNVYSDEGDPRKAIEYYEQALKIAREIGDQRGKGANLGNIGNAYSCLGEPRKAIEYYEQALNISREIRDRRYEGANLGNLGLAYFYLREYKKAIEYHEQALKIACEIGDRRGEGNRLGNLGLVYSGLREPRKAIEYHEQALKIACEIGDRRGEGNRLGNLGLVYSGLGEPRKAIEYHEQELKIACEIGDRRGEGNCLGNLGNAYSCLGESRKAIECYDQALKIACEIGDRRKEGKYLGNLGRVYSELNEPRKAIEYYEQALDIAREIGDRRSEGEDLFNISLSLKELGLRDRAVSLAESAIAIMEEIRDHQRQDLPQSSGRVKDSPQATFLFNSL